MCVELGLLRRLRTPRATPVKNSKRLGSKNQFTAFDTFNIVFIITSLSSNPSKWLTAQLSSCAAGKAGLRSTERERCTSAASSERSWSFFSGSSSAASCTASTTGSASELFASTAACKRALNNRRPFSPWNSAQYGRFSATLSKLQAKRKTHWRARSTPSSGSVGISPALLTSLPRKTASGCEVVFPDTAAICWEMKVPMSMVKSMVLLMESRSVALSSGM
mmetsp:Transcript_120826/g.352980  ORF Transcript_120826/g.352980 Transcript_120826/m.352980 type:complete len:221 (-) Transcript_120826:1519-2181(-)